MHAINTKLHAAVLESAVLSALTDTNPDCKLELMIQPIIDLSTNRIACHETLMRVVTRDEILVPSDILPVARLLGVSSVLDALVIHKAALLTESYGPLTVNVVSVASAVQCLSRFRGYPLKVEISERDPSLASGSLPVHVSKLKEFGIEAVLDDFGEGDVRCPHIQSGVTGVKLDRGLTRMLANGGLAAEGLTLMLAYLKSAGMQLVAEGVETAEDMESMTGIATHAQGWHYGLPHFPTR